MRFLLVFLGAFVGWVRDRVTRMLSARPEPRADDSQTEFTCEVVRITQILPHPNADKLELARFAMTSGEEAAYEVVVGKGNHVVGDLVGYVSVDCIVPTKRPEFSFLKDRLDGKGKDYYRIKAARLRGVFSQGLIVPVEGYSLGAKLAGALDVTYHSTEVEAPAVQHGTGKGRSRSLPVPIYGVTSLKKDPRLLQPGEDAIITEKIHGSCAEFGWIPRKILGIRVGYKFIVGSHRQLKDGSEGEADVWMEAARRMDLASKTKGCPGLVFYGEVFGYGYTGKPIQDLTYGRTPETGPGLRIFDVLQVAPQKWLDPETRAAAVLSCGLIPVPVLYHGPLEGGIIGKLAEGVSTLDPKTIREGVVVEATDGSHRKGKFVSQGYLLRKTA